VPISQPDLVSSGTRLSNGTFLHKLEIVVQFFQVYCIILWMADNNNLPWPAYWKSVKTGYDWPPVLLSVDVQTAYALRGVSIDGAFREVRVCHETLLWTRGLKSAFVRVSVREIRHHRCLADTRSVAVCVILSNNIGTMVSNSEWRCRTRIDSELVSPGCMPV
jgi:hypothetical protein